LKTHRQKSILYFEKWDFQKDAFIEKSDKKNNKK